METHASAITKTALSGSYKYRFTFTITDAVARAKLIANQLALHVVSLSNPVGYQWKDPHHKVKPPGTGGGGGPIDPGYCDGSIAHCVPN